jgi:hypothetical protein
MAPPAMTAPPHVPAMPFNEGEHKVRPYTVMAVPCHAV